MYYTSRQDLVNAVIQWSDDTNITAYSNSSEREERICHYLDRAIELVWNARPWWSFRKGFTTVTLFSGQAELPDDFGGLGDDGYVVLSGSTNLPWVEVDYQELIAIRRNRVWPARFQNQQVFAIGPAIPGEPVAVSDGEVQSPSADTYTLYSTGNNLPGSAYIGQLVSVAGFADADNNGEFVITAVNTQNQSWDINTRDGGDVGGVEGATAITVGAGQSDRVSLVSGRAEDGRTIDIYYDRALPNIDPNYLNRPLNLPAYTHHAILTGAIWYASRGKNDAREEEFRRDFMKALSDAIRSGRRTAHRPTQMPMSVGRMW
ncbi:MAG: hypothetical protein GTO63_15725 [Anaerolineae bacterium]|nr:hypothetical protein [Anaerolineae bacterium]NIN96278.1 hypothetical protein [Anaerolineae bacterium]NIQ79298.1 hypothetical protein [Anaerolineae bacterium]